MVPLPSVAQVVKFSYQHVTNTVPLYVHAFFHYNGTAPATADMLNVCNALHTAWVTNIAPVQNAQVVLTAIVGTDLTTPASAQSQWTGSSPGTRAGASNTANDCTLMNLHIQRRYRGGKPRQYWPWGSATDLNDPQHWSSGFVTAAQSAWSNQYTSTLAQTWGTNGKFDQQVNVSYYLGSTSYTSGSPPYVRGHTKPTPRTGGPITDNVLTFTVNPRIATQRRRQHFSV